MEKRQPNKEEQLVIDWLSRQGYENIYPEPDGNIPPDIVVNGRIAIEVRRLNENIRAGNSLEGLETGDYAVYNAVSQVIEAFKAETIKNSSIVSYYYRRPVNNFKKLKRELKKVLDIHVTCIEQRKQYFIGGDFEINFWPLQERLENVFVFGASADFDSGGNLLDILYTNMKWVVEEKSKKIQHVKSRYDEWWLALVDTIALGLNEQDIKDFYTLPKIESSFDRMLMISPLTPDKAIFLYEEEH